jgi:hypothetical protein
MRLALVTAPLAIALAGILTALAVGEMPPKKFSDRITFERGTVQEHDGRKFVTQRLRDK